MSISWQDRYQLWRGPDRTIRQMTYDDIPGVITLSERVGWSLLERDIERLLDWSPDGCFVMVEQDGRLIGTVSTTPYGTELAWIGTLIVAPESQRSGLGGQLMRAVLDHLIARGTQRIMLDSSDVARPMYKKLGFHELYKIEVWEGRASTYLGPRARRMRPADLPAVLKMDQSLFGISRAHILTRLFEVYPHLAWIDDPREKLEGYLLGRPAKNGFYLGPWMSLSAASAERLLLIALEQLQGQQIRLNIPDCNGRGVILASDHNLRRTGHRTRMIYGDAQMIGRDLLAELGITSLATG